MRIAPLPLLRRLDDVVRLTSGHIVQLVATTIIVSSSQVCEQVIHFFSEEYLPISLLRTMRENFDKNPIGVAFPINVRLQPQISLRLSHFIIALKLTRSPSLRKRLEISLL